MIHDDGDTTELIGRIGRGDLMAREQLLGRIRARLRNMIASRMDNRLASRVDPSDVVQDALAVADRSLTRYVRDRPIPFVPWLRRLAWERLVEARRRHIGSTRRSVFREATADRRADESGEVDDALRKLDDDSSPSRRAILAESRGQVRALLDQLPAQDRQLLVMRYFDQSSVGEIAETLGISPGAVMTRHTRALARLRNRLGTGSNLEGI